MNPRTRCWGIALAIAVFIPATLLATPMMINMQGQLTTDVGDAVADGNYLIEFRLFDAETGGTQRWSTGGNVEVTVESGLFNYMLGSNVPLPFWVADYDSLWLEMVPDGQPPMAPRMRLASAMWAIRAAYADTASVAWGVVNGTSKWNVSNDVLYTDQMWGLARGSSGNALYGTRNDHINFGVACTTGTDGQNYFYANVLGGYGNRAGHSLAIVVGGQSNRAMGAASTIAGGTDNCAEMEYSTVAGGQNNNSGGNYCAIGGGMDNLAGGEASTVAGGIENLVGGAYGTIAGGYGNHANGAYSTIGGGINNEAESNAVVGGGGSNHALGSYSAIAGGAQNSTNGLGEFIGAGSQNSTNADYAVIGGGYTDTVNGLFGCVVGGYRNVAGDEDTDTAAFVGTGYENRAEAPYTAVVSGWRNIARAKYSTVGGGRNNVAGEWAATVAGGQGNTITGPEGTICGGTGNTADSRGFVGGGDMNTATGYTTTISGGEWNYADQGSAIGGGRYNAARGYVSTIGGGNRDTVNGAFGFIGGGYVNHAGREDADSCNVIGGGWYNTTIGKFTSVVGGWQNEANSPYATVVGGADNTANDTYAFVGAGNGNRSSGYAAVVAGGFNNVADAAYSAILGGINDTINYGGSYSYLFGIGSKLTQDSTFMVDMPHIHFGDEVDGYEFPPEDGNGGQVLATDGSGQLDWTDVSSIGNGWTDDGGVVRLQTATDNVGIGTAGPDAKLHVDGAIRLGSGSRNFEVFEALATDPAGWSQYIEYDGIAIGSMDGGNRQMFIFSDGANQYNIFTVATSQNSGSTWEADFIIEQDGDVGIGVLNPTASLEVNGMIHSHAEGYKFPDGTVQTTANQWTLSGDILATLDSYGISRGNVGNHFYGTNANTMTNLGVACTTGANGFDFAYAAVGGGEGNTASGTSVTISGGQDNLAFGTYSTISGGRQNYTGTTAATIGGGDGNRATGLQSTVGGGAHNLAMGWSSTVGGGEADTAHGKFCTVAGGYSNYAGGEYDSSSFIGGGDNNRASDDGAVVCGGSNNTASGYYSTVGGGFNNVVSDQTGTIPGGHDNTVSGANAVICGGAGNSTAAQRSVILGGINNELTVAADFSVAFGSQIYVENPFRVVFFDALNPGRLGLNRDDGNGGIDYPIHVGTSAANGNGAHLTNGGVWTNASSRSFKEDFRPLDGDDVLARIAGLQIETWAYKDSDERHIGPVAEDFVAAFDVGTTKPDGTRENQYLSTADVAGAALLGVKELVAENQELKQVIEELRRQIAELREQ